MIKKTYEVVPDPAGFPVFIIKYKEGGNTPLALKGRYTRVQTAWKAIEAYERNKESEKKRLATKRRLESVRKNKRRDKELHAGAGDGSHPS